MALLGRVGGYGGALSPTAMAPIKIGYFPRKHFSLQNLFAVVVSCLLTLRLHAWFLK